MNHLMRAQKIQNWTFYSNITHFCLKQDEIVPISVPSLLEKAAKEAPEILALSVKRDEKWIKWTYKEYLQGNLYNLT